MSIFNEQNSETLMLYAVLSQSLWGLLQTTMLEVFMFDEDTSNRVRVMLVICTMMYAIMWGFRNKTSFFTVTYTVMLFILLLTVAIFPQNSSFLYSEASKFTLPLVIPSFLCLASVTDIKKVENIFYKISWFSVLIAVVYAYTIVTGKFTFSNYSMSFSFSLLLPALVLYAHKSKSSIFASLLLFIEIVALGSRSAAIVMVTFVVLDAIIFSKKSILPIAIIIFIVISMIGTLGIFFESFGISSRTLLLFQSEEGIIGHMSNRDDIYDLVILKIHQNELIGLGLYGDRLFLDGSTCHNLILEILLHFGIFLGTGLILILFTFLIKVFFKISMEQRQIFLRYFCAVIIPLMVSGSYLKDYNLGLFLGIAYMLNKSQNINNYI